MNFKIFPKCRWALKPQLHKWFFPSPWCSQWWLQLVTTLGSKWVLLQKFNSLDFWELFFCNFLLPPLCMCDCCCLLVMQQFFCQLALLVHHSSPGNLVGANNKKKLYISLPVHMHGSAHKVTYFHYEIVAVSMISVCEVWQARPPCLSLTSCL